jgi:hypothetical protein
MFLIVIPLRNCKLSDYMDDFNPGVEDDFNPGVN